MLNQFFSVTDCLIIGVLTTALSPRGSLTTRRFHTAKPSECAFIHSVTIYEHYWIGQPTMQYMSHSEHSERPLLNAWIWLIWLQCSVTLLVGSSYELLFCFYAWRYFFGKVVSLPVVSLPNGEIAEWWNRRVVNPPRGDSAVVRAPWWERRVVRSPGIQLPRGC